MSQHLAVALITVGSSIVTTAGVIIVSHHAARREREGAITWLNYRPETEGMRTLILALLAVLAFLVVWKS